MVHIANSTDDFGSFNHKVRRCLILFAALPLSLPSPIVWEMEEHGNIDAFVFIVGLEEGRSSAAPVTRGYTSAEWCMTRLMRVKLLGQCQPAVISDRTLGFVLHATIHDLPPSSSSSTHVSDRIANSLSINVYCLLPIVFVYHHFPLTFYAISTIGVTGLYIWKS